MISLSMAKPAVPPAIRSALQRLGVGVAVTALATCTRRRSWNVMTFRRNVVTF